MAKMGRLRKKNEKRELISNHTSPSCSSSGASSLSYSWGGRGGGGVDMGGVGCSFGVHEKWWRAGGGGKICALHKRWGFRKVRKSRALSSAEMVTGDSKRCHMKASLVESLVQVSLSHTHTLNADFKARLSLKCKSLSNASLSQGLSLKSLSQMQVSLRVSLSSFSLKSLSQMQVSLKSLSQVAHKSHTHTHFDSLSALKSLTSLSQGSHKSLSQVSLSKSLSQSLSQASLSRVSHTHLDSLLAADPPLHLDL